MERIESELCKDMWSNLCGNKAGNFSLNNNNNLHNDGYARSSGGAGGGAGAGGTGDNGEDTSVFTRQLSNPATGGVSMTQNFAILKLNKHEQWWMKLTQHQHALCEMRN